MNDPKPPLVLTREEKSSALWRKLMAYWEHRLVVLQTQNESDMPENYTSKIRGRCAEIRVNLALNNDPIKE